MQLSDFPFVTTDKVRYNDTDRQGHVNNAIYATYMELARVEVLNLPDFALLDGETSIVLARLAIDFRAEAHWPGEVQIGTRVARIGNSSIEFEQAVFQHGKLCAQASAVVVLIHGQTRRSHPLPADVKARIAKYLPASGAST